MMSAKYVLLILSPQQWWLWISGTAYGIVVNKADGAVAGDYIVDDYLFRSKFFHWGYVMSIFINNYM